MLPPGSAPQPSQSQVYFDFSGYSDMAIGMAQLLP